MDAPQPDLTDFFTDIAIIDQLVRTLRERRLPPGLSTAGFGLINHMVRTGQETASPAALARALQVTRGAVTGVLHKLTAEGFVTLEPDPTDGRGKKVRITPAGMAAREAALADGRGKKARITPAGMAAREAALASVAPLAARFEVEMDVEAIRRIHPVIREVRDYLDRNREG